jgi:hypothetical protein
MNLSEVELEATHLRGRNYAVRPRGQLGTCGFYPVPWTVQYVKADSENAAVRKAHTVYMVDRLAA